MRTEAKREQAMEPENEINIEVTGMGNTSGSSNDENGSRNNPERGTDMNEHTTMDPCPPPHNATAETIAIYNESLRKYVKEWCETYNGIAKISSSTIWCDFTGDFSLFGLQNLTGNEVTSIRNILLSHGIFVYQRRGFPKLKALVECWQKEECPMVKNNAKEQEEDIAIDAAEVSVEAAKKAKSISKALEHKFDKIVKENGVDNAETNHSVKGDPITGSSQKSSVSLQGLIKAFGNRPKYNGLWDEDLIGTIEVFELAAEMCNVSEQEMLRGIPIMLDGAALSYYGSHVKGKVTNYKDALNQLLSWFTSDEQRSRLLSEWHETRLRTWFKRHPEKSQLSVFREMSARLSNIQRQLDTKYREDIFLRDQIITATNIEHVRRALKINTPLTAHEANQKIASFLSSEPRSAGNYCDEGDNGDVFFGIGQKFKGGAERRIIPYKRDGKRPGSSRRTLSKIKGCWVCGADHLANRFHPKADVDNALKKLRTQNAYLSVDDVYSVFLTDDHSDLYESDASENEEDQNAGLITTEVCDINKQLESALSNNVFLHSCGFYVDRKRHMEKMERALSETERPSEFNGMIIDTGANRLSLMSINQYRAYCTEFGIVANIRKDSRKIYGLGSKHRSIGTAKISIPFPKFGMICDINFHILSENCKTLLSRVDLKNTGIDLSIQRDCLLFNDIELPLQVQNDLLVYNWLPNVAMFTYDELKKLHRSFGHPTVSTLYNLLRRARKEECHKDVRDAIEQLTESCKVCSEHSSKPKRFKLSIGTEDGRFNSVVAVDIMYLGGKPVLHAVDETTHFAAASFLKNISATEVWKTFTRIWTHVYMGPPDYLRLDQGSQFTSHEFISSATSTGIELLHSPIENPASMSHVERYHAPLRKAFQKLEADLPKEKAADILQMAVHCVNSTIGPEGLCPTLCVFGAIPKPARNCPAPQQIERARAIDDAIREVEREQTKRKVTFGLRYRGPYGKERSDLDNLHFGAPVRVYRPKTDIWEGPFKFIWKDNETVCVQLPNGRKLFRSHVVKHDRSHNTEDTMIDKPTSEEITPEALCCLFQEPKLNANHILVTDHNNQFRDSRQQELRGLQEAGVFRIVSRSDVPPGTRIYGTRWVDTIKKNDDGTVKEKSRLVAQNYRDMSSRGVPTKAPTISRFGQRIALCIAAMYPQHTPYVRDITQAYIQSKDSLLRKVFLRPPSEMNLSDDAILLAVKPLYGIPESGLYWFITYRDHHVRKIGMTPCTTDNCLLYRHESDSTSDSSPSITILQVDDSFGVGCKQFLQDEEQHSREFKTKPRKLLSLGSSCIFNGSTITRELSGAYSLTQRDKLSSLCMPESKDEAISTRAKIQYVSTSCRPDLCSPVQLLTAQLTQGSSTSKKNLEDIVKCCLKSTKDGLRYIRLDEDTAHLILFTDSSFGNSDGLSSQAGFLIILADGQGKANIIHYGSKKCRRITRSVMAAEILALVNGYDEAFIVKHTMEEILKRKIHLDVYIDSRTTFNCVAKHAPTLEKRLQIDVSALRESHMRGEIRTIGWIPGSKNPADGLTRDKIVNSHHPLIQLMKTNSITIEATGWAEINEFGTSCSEKENALVSDFKR